MHPIKTKLTVLLVGVACLAVGVLFASSLEWTPDTQAHQTGSVPTTEASLRQTGNAFTRIAAEVTPSVVYIEGQRVVGRGEVPFDFGPFEDFFEFRAPRNQEGEPLRRRSGGSGVIVRGNGYIVTNNHVVEGMEGLQVVLNDRRTFDAEIVGRDPSTDVAVLKIDADALPVAHMASDGQVQVGEWVLALGNPLGLQFTMTAGIVSAIGRSALNIINSAENPYAIEDFIQTDAAINPGNSGGPLVNIDGQVIGINTAIASRSGGYQGYGFAIPVAIVRRVMEQLIETGEVRRAVLGVSIQPVTPLDQEALGLARAEGVLVADYDSRVADNPARRAGLRPRDVILSVDGKTVRTPSELQQAIAFHEPGDHVELVVWRDGNDRTLEVELGERPSASAATQFVTDPDRTSSEAALGMEVQELSGEDRATLAQRANLDAGAIPDGVVVRSVAPLGAADEAQIPRGAIITQVGDRPVRDLTEYRAAVDVLDPGSVVQIRIYLIGANGQLFRSLRVPR